VCSNSYRTYNVDGTSAECTGTVVVQRSSGFRQALGPAPLRLGSFKVVSPVMAIILA
jgi:hypothetical protein